MKKILGFSLCMSLFLSITIQGNSLLPDGPKIQTIEVQKSARGRGLVRGLVVNQHHKPLANVQVQIKHITSDDFPLVLTTSTDKRGRWTIAGVGPVQWTLEASLPNYNSYRKTLMTSNFSDKIPMVRTVLRKIVREEVLGLADLDYISFESSDLIASAIAISDSKIIESFIKKNKEKLDRDFFIALGNGYFDYELYPQAMKYYSMGPFKRGANRIGDRYLKLNRLERALEYYEQGIATEARAYTYGLKADQLKRENNQQERKKYLNLAQQDYDAVIKNCTFSWKKTANLNRRRIMKELDSYPKSPIEQAREKKLQKLLEGAARYCRLLENSAIYFYCYEEVVERSNLPKEELYPEINKLTPESKLKAWQKRRYRFIYDYQLYKEGSTLREQRTLVRKNGRKRKKKNAKLSTIYQISRIISGPVGLISRSWQAHTDYKIVAQKKKGRNKISVVQCFPRSFRQKNHLFGEVWIRERDFRIIKIVWYPFSIGNRTVIEGLARLFKRTPRITFISEYGVSKNGIQFPSRCLVKEEYLGATGQAFTRILDTYEYKKYHFFKVQTAVQTRDLEDT